MIVRLLVDPPEPVRRTSLNWLELVFLLLGMVGLGSYLYTRIDSNIYQAREAQQLEESLQQASEGPVEKKDTRPLELIAKIDVPRVGVSAIVRDGIDSKTLRRAVGHVPGTAVPGQVGNVALAGHRDTFFRGLRSIRKNDQILVRRPQARTNMSSIRSKS